MNISSTWRYFRFILTINRHALTGELSIKSGNIIKVDEIIIIGLLNFSAWQLLVQPVSKIPWIYIYNDLSDSLRVIWEWWPTSFSWWRQDMTTLSTIRVLVLFWGEITVNGYKGTPPPPPPPPPPPTHTHTHTHTHTPQVLVMWNLDVLFHFSMNKLLNKRSGCRFLEAIERPR